MAQKLWLGFDTTVSAGQWNDHQRDIYGSLIVSGFRARAKSPASMVLDLKMETAASNALYANGIRVEETSDVLSACTIAAAHATYARKDVLVCRYVFGVKGAVATYVVLQGTAAASPVEPAIIASSDCKLAVVNVRASTTSILDTDIAVSPELTLANQKFRIRADGTAEFGDGAGLWDVAVNRSGAGILAVNGKFQAPTFKSTVLTGSGAPFEVSSIDLVANLNAERLGGYKVGNAAGLVPVSNGTMNVTLNAEFVGGYRADASATASTVPVRNGAGKIPGDILGDANSVQGKQPGAVSGLATLDTNVLVPLVQIPGALTGKSAEFVGGYRADTGTTTNTVPVRNGAGKIPGDILGDANSVQGKQPGISSGLATLGSDGRVPAAQLPASATGSFIPTGDKGAPSGVAPLDASALVPLANLPNDLVGKNATTVGGKAPGAASGIATLNASGQHTDTQIPAAVVRTTDFNTYRRLTFAKSLFGV